MGTATASAKGPRIREVDWRSKSIVASTVKLDHPEYGVLAVPLKIDRSGDANKGIADSSDFPQCSLQHYYSLCVHRREMAIAAVGVRRATREEGLEREIWEGLSAYDGDGRSNRDEYVLRLGNVQVYEAIHRLVMDAYPSWRSFLASDADPDEADAIERLRQTDDGVRWRHPLTDGGSLIQFSNLDIHPLIRSQGVGQRLIGHVLWELSRHRGDLASIFVHPSCLYVDHAEQRRRIKPEHITELVSLAERWGFALAEPRAEPLTNAPVQAYRHVGEFGFPLAGLGRLSALAGIAELDHKSAAIEERDNTT